MKQLKLALLSVAVAYAAGWFISLEPNVFEWNGFGRYVLLIVSSGLFCALSAWKSSL
ncbi:hypothetical protein HBO32_30850 [Pseudomonas nitroreducens]|uniref:hypothetical protein n=1 Tax=Pseudomonas aeruginosa group TaxID=136841 RepID=UPI001475AAC2|nr:MULTISPECIES: hypothetical protein [Pseudomonas aeruginosa group]NMZ77498.1 hypothetical protein [Pseudomonas nitroreducens]